MAMDYAAALQYVQSLGKFGINLGMERIAGLAERLGHPERKIRTIHITGTNGKGSVASYLSHILTAAGRKTGCYTSPHFVRYNERMTLDGKEITDADFASVTETVKEAVEAFMADGGEQPTQFEVLTAMGFLYFAQNVTLEHTERLGRTIAAIAQQKAGIIKEGIPVVTSCEGEALRVIRETAAAKHCALYELGRDFSCTPLQSTMAAQTFAYGSDGRRTEVTIHLAGAHQLLNGAVALKAAEVLAGKDAAITREAMLRGMAETTWPGRLELIHQHPDIILDGAHNPSGVTVLRKALDAYYPKAIRHDGG